MSSSHSHVSEVIVMSMRLRHKVVDALMIIVRVIGRASFIDLCYVHLHSVWVVEGVATIPNRQILLIRGCLELIGLRAFLTLIVT